MAEDIIDFGPAGAPPRTATAWRPGFRDGAALPLAVAGVVAAAASLIGPWQKLDGNSRAISLGPNEPTVTADQTGIYGFMVLFGLMGLITAATVALFAPARARRIAALAGCGLSLATLLFVGVMVYKLGRSTAFGGTPEGITFTLGWGIYAAGGSVVAFGLSMLALRPVALRRVATTHAEAVTDDIDLDVRVEPA
jgi:hypothetical protein